MSELTRYIKQMSLWWFIAIITSLVLGISISLIALQRYLLHGEISREPFIIGIVATAITAITIVTLTGFVFRQLRAEDEKLQLAARVFNDAHEGIIIANIDNKIVDVNPTFCKITEYSRVELIGKSTDMLISNTNKGKFYLNIWRALSKRSHWKGEIWSRKKNGLLFIGQLTISTILRDEGETLHYVCLVSDLTQSKKQEQELEFMAHYDVLTKLPNRGVFAEHFEKAVKNSKQSNTLLAICLFDIDHFKPINDNFGHVIGDQLLIEIARRIEVKLRNNDFVSRLGGDEFVLLLGDLRSVSECKQLLDVLHNALAESYFIEDKTIITSASSGVTIYPNDNADPDTLLRHADQAMYKAKLAGRNHYQLFNTEDNQLIIQKHYRLQEIRTALMNDEFCLYYQPKINMKTGEVYGAEALIRWQHPTKGLIPPLEFLPIIDSTDLEIDIGNWVFQNAIHQLDIWKNLRLDLELSINVSSYHLQSPSFFVQLTTALDKYPNVESKYLQLEILESSVLSDLNTIGTIINTCRNSLGVSIALDDFGTGYSSLNHLRHLKAKTVKIDRSFVIDMLDNPNDYAIVDGVISLADTFNREVIAEGVETTEHGLMLLIMGCECAQGYGISPPMPADRFPYWIKHHHPNHEWISCGNKTHSTDSRRLTLLNLITHQWVNQFKKNIHASPDDILNWPTMNHTDCHCATWIKRSKKERLFDAHHLNSLEQAHKALHLLAEELQTKYLAGNVEYARDGLNQLELTLDELTQINSVKTVKI